MSASGSISSYSPIETNEEATQERFIASSSSQPNIVSHSSINSISTFSSIEQGDEIEDDTLFETFNGSTNDYATAIPTATVDSKPVPSTEPLNISKVRQQQQQPNEEAELSPEPEEAAYKPTNTVIKRSFTPMDPPTQPDASVVRLQALETNLVQLEDKRDKLTREIAYVDSLLRSHGREDNMEIKKLHFGREKLQERKLDTVKAIYDMGVKIAKLRRASGSNPVTDYFVRKASLES